MAGTTDMLRSTLGENGFAVLLAVAGQASPVSGRTIAAELKVSPTTASSRLGRLDDAGFVRSSRSGRSVLWRLNTDSDVVRAWLREGRGAEGPVVAEAGSSPVSTGGGGVTFERKVAADYLARMLLGDAAVGCGSSRVVVSVAFQQAPDFTVDDLVIEAAVEGEGEPSRVLAVAARRAPDVVDSDKKSQKLFRGFVQQLLSNPADGPDLGLGLAVSGPQDHAQQLAVLAKHAASQRRPDGFYRLVQTPKKFDSGVRGRLLQVEKLVRRALIDLGISAPSAALVEQRTWELLSRLVVWMPRVEIGDDPDWSALANSLKPVSRGEDLYGATLLRDRLLTLADDWAPVAASVDVAMLRRAVHDLLESAARRHQAGWHALELLGEQARAAVDGEIVSTDGAHRVQLSRDDVMAELMAAVGSGFGVVVHGESGVGKSAIALRLLSTASTTAQAAVAPEADASPDAAAEAESVAESQIVCMNLRHLPGTALEFEGALGVPLRDLLAEMSAPTRVVVVDGADAVAEGAQGLLTYVVDAAVAARVTVVAVTAGDAKQLVMDTMAGRVPHGAVEVVVPPLTDAQVDAVVGEFGELEGMAANPRSRELLRRPVVAALLVRGGVRGIPVSDFDAMTQVWDGLIRGGGPNKRGTPHARDVAMRQLARQALRGGDALDLAASIDPAALAGLQQDGLLRTSQDNPFRPLPEFTHDEVRRYAVARLLLADDDPTRVLVEAGVPRWSLGAARLACQALLAATGSASNPVAGRFARWQSKFDELVVAGHGERWADVPGEALLTLGNPRPVLRDAWPQLLAADRAGVRHLVRLTDQRLRGQNSFVRIAAAEPLIEQLLEDETPWRSGEEERTLLLEWLRSLVVSNVPAGHALRGQLRARLLEFCAGCEARFREAVVARAEAQAALIDEQRAAHDAHVKTLPIASGLVGYPRGRPRRRRPAISREITDKTVMELFALLGPDLGEDGEAMLRRVAEANPRALAPALEGVVCGRALGGYRRGFLADLTLAYYMDEEQDGTGGLHHDDGVRDHQGFSLGMPLAAWYRGPFMALFQTDFRNGVLVLNRLLNHAATARARMLAGNHRYYEPAQDSDLDRYSTELAITGASRVYVGDSGTWNWYRGTGVGPYPCMSALQALERVCDDILGLGVPLDVMIPILLDGCDNVAMVALVVGVLVRHLDKAGKLLDRFLAEPDIWHLEFGRIVHEYGGLRGTSEGIVGADRRTWSLREAATSLLLAAGPERAEELRLVGQQLVQNARRCLAQLGDAVPASSAEKELNTVRAWASGLDRSTYTMQRADEGYLIESHPPTEVAAALSAGMGEVVRGREVARLIVRYHVKQENGTAEPITTEDLVADLNSAITLLHDSAEMDATGWDAPAAVAAYALTQHIVHGQPLPNDSVKLAVDILFRVGEGEMPPPTYDIEESYFSQGADRSAARALPLLLTSAAHRVRRVLDGSDEHAAYARAEAAVAGLACSNVLQTRLFLARGLDHVWATPCTFDATCPHRAALRLTIDTMRDCVLGQWDMELQEHAIGTLDDPVADTLPGVPDDCIYAPRLDAAIRALGPAAASSVCVSEEARALLDVLLHGQRRALLADERGVDHRGSHSLASARSLLTLDDDDAIFNHIDAYIDDSTMLDQTLRALSAAAEESRQRAATARRVWPSLVARVIDAHDAGHTPFENEFYGKDYSLAALLPNLAGEMTYLHSEHDGKPIVWWDPIAWQATVDRWLQVAGGKPTCVDNLVWFVASSLSAAEQAQVGVPWISQAVLTHPAAVASRCYGLTNWLIEIRTAAEEMGLSSEWQRVVDALVVAGDNRLAPYSE